MKNFDVLCDGKFIGRVSSENLRKLQRKMPFQGVSFIETVKGLDCSVVVKPASNFEQIDQGLCILHPPCK